MASGPRESIIAALEREDVVWVSSIRPDGRPHLAAVWFLWDGDSILVFSKPNAQKVRNVRANPSVMIAVGQPGIDFDVELIEGVAELDETATSRLLPRSFETKYAHLVARAGVALDRFAAVYSQPIRIRPSRWLGWGGATWLDTPSGATPPV